MHTCIECADKDLPFRFWVASFWTVARSFFHSTASWRFPCPLFYRKPLHQLDSQGVKLWLVSLLVGIYTRRFDLYALGRFWLLCSQHFQQNLTILPILFAVMGGGRK